ncbi:PREDICTED: presqualene diphosphate phosphatase [Polistes dominula]|uniref:Presqualene diphosphate phosphatase n=1 Tax=Polistes dominula TaxID=743375 RepID=A0ABM1IV24_POLDO|nr:PREDICTED: presqualene diphosphate phosphatase [Polistes dominula]
MDQTKKRQVPSSLKKILAFDIYLSYAFVTTFEKYVTFKQLKTHYKALEISCHGITWMALTLASIWIFNSTSLYQMQVNLFIGFIIDIFITAILKALTRRRRPAVNDDLFSIGPDKYSFPSGHASRSTFIVYFFLYIWEVPSIFTLSLISWCVCVCLSRLLMRRHNILDICAGIGLGIIEAKFINYLYLSQETCINLISWITSERVDDL